MRKVELYQKITSLPLPKHLAIILDGNGRWARMRLLPRNMGHAKGIKTLREVVDSAHHLGIKNVTVFAFSTENWNRPDTEVNFLMTELKKFCRDGLKRVLEKQIRIKFIGTRQGLDEELKTLMDETEKATKSFDNFTLTLAFNYGAHEEIINACKKIATKVVNNEITVNNIDEQLFNSMLYTADLLPVDLVIRTSGEMRLSNFLLYQISYAEIYFTKTLWPDFHQKELYEAIDNYQGRHRRFGKVEE